MINIKAETALVTGSSRGIGRGIALKLAESGVKRIGVHYLKNREAAEATINQAREAWRGADSGSQEIAELTSLAERVG